MWSKYPHLYLLLWEKIKELQKVRAKTELKIKLLQIINEYKSVEEPSVVLSNDDIVNVLSSMIVRRTE